MCEACLQLRDRSRRKPPHAMLEKTGEARRSATLEWQPYRCARCGQKWLREIGPLALGWLVDK